MILMWKTIVQIWLETRDAQDLAWQRCWTLRRSSCDYSELVVFVMLLTKLTLNAARPVSFKTRHKPRMSNRTLKSVKNLIVFSGARFSSPHPDDGFCLNNTINTVRYSAPVKHCTDLPIDTKRLYELIKTVLQLGLKHSNRKFQQIVFVLMLSKIS